MLALPLLSHVLRLPRFGRCRWHRSGFMAESLPLGTLSPGDGHTVRCSVLLLMLTPLSASLALWLACSPLRSHGMPGVVVPRSWGGEPSSAGKAPHFQAQTHPVTAPNDHHCHRRFPARGSCGSTACADGSQPVSRAPLMPSSLSFPTLGRKVTRHSEVPWFAAYRGPAKQEPPAPLMVPT